MPSAPWRRMKYFTHHGGNLVAREKNIIKSSTHLIQLDAPPSLYSLSCYPWRRNQCEFLLLTKRPLRHREKEEGISSCYPQSLPRRRRRSINDNMTEGLRRRRRRGDGGGYNNIIKIRIYNKRYTPGSILLLLLLLLHLHLLLVRLPFRHRLTD